MNLLKSFWQKAWWSKLIVVIIGFFILSGINSVLSPKAQKSFKEGIEKGGEVANTNLSPKPSPTPEPTVTPTTEATTPAPTQTPTPSLSPSPIPTPTPSPLPTSTPAQAKQVSFSVFKKYFQDNFDYGQFTKAFTSSDNWDFWESDNLYGDKLILAAISEDLKNGILKTGPNDTAATQVVTFFLLGHPPLISSGWVENTASIIEKGKKEETTLQGVDASIMLSPDGVWIVSFMEK